MIHSLFKMNRFTPFFITHYHLMFCLFIIVMPSFDSLTGGIKKLFPQTIARLPRIEPEQMKVPRPTPLDIVVCLKGSVKCVPLPPRHPFPANQKPVPLSQVHYRL